MLQVPRRDFTWFTITFVITGQQDTE